MAHRWYPNIGPRPDAESTNGLAVLVPGLDRLPSACCHCGSALLSQEQPLGQHRYGSVVCSTCSRQLCWLDVPLRVAPRRDPVQVPRHPRPPLPPRSAATTGSSPWPGCGPGCRRERVVVIGRRTGAEWRDYHDAAAHDRYQHALTIALAVLASTRSVAPAAIVRTGPLVVDTRAGRPVVNGTARPLTPTEWDILVCLSLRAGELCSREALLAAVWPDDTSRRYREPVMLGCADPYQLLRVHVQRLRPKLGAAGRLIEMVVGRGYVLRLEPPIAETEAT